MSIATTIRSHSTDQAAARALSFVPSATIDQTRASHRFRSDVSPRIAEGTWRQVNNSSALTSPMDGVPSPSLAFFSVTAVTVGLTAKALARGAGEADGFGAPRRKP
jgi:hypothetical protein